MMFAKTFCKPGSYVEVAPIGLQAMLEYNASGLLHSVKILQPNEVGYGFIQEVDNETLRKIYSLVPTKINLKGGTTYIEGTFFTPHLPDHSTGNIAYCANDEYISMIREGMYFDFYAGNVISLAASFKGALTVRNWLSGNGFKSLPGIVVPIEMKQETLDMLFSSFSCPFDSNFLAGFYIFEGVDQARFTLTDLCYNKVTEFSMKVDSDGYAKGLVMLDDNEEIHVLNLADAAHFNCDKSPNVRILYHKHSDGRIELYKGITTSTDDKMRSYTCPICHKQVALPATGPCQCSDPHCMSVLYPEASKMLSRLALPELPYETYNELVQNKDIFCITDLLTLDIYKDSKIEASIADVLSAITPVEVVADDTIFERFANSCNNSIDSVMYYLKNPNRIATELNLNNPQVIRFIKWVSDPYNLTSVETLLAAVDLKARSKKFEGAPIFRNNAFVITGKFKRGNFKEVASILESYEATVLTDIDITGTHIVPNGVITGGTNESISGYIIKTARAHNIPIISEDEFFANYGIDEDLAANLL